MMKCFHPLRRSALLVAASALALSAPALAVEPEEETVPGMEEGEVHSPADSEDLSKTFKEYKAEQEAEEAEEAEQEAQRAEEQAKQLRERADEERKEADEAQKDLDGIVPDTEPAPEETTIPEAVEPEGDL